VKFLIFVIVIIDDEVLEISIFISIFILIIREVILRTMFLVSVYVTIIEVTVVIILGVIIFHFFLWRVHFGLLDATSGSRNHRFYYSLLFKYLG